MHVKHFNSLAGSHRNYFSKWIDSAKTEQTKTKRIAMALSALSRGLGYPEMMREDKAKRRLLRMNNWCLLLQVLLFFLFQQIQSIQHNHLDKFFCPCYAHNFL